MPPRTEPRRPENVNRDSGTQSAPGCWHPNGLRGAAMTRSAYQEASIVYELNVRVPCKINPSKRENGGDVSRDALAPCLVADQQTKSPANRNQAEYQCRDVEVAATNKRRIQGKGDGMNKRGADRPRSCSTDRRANRKVWGGGFHVRVMTPIDYTK